MGHCSLGYTKGLRNTLVCGIGILNPLLGTTDSRLCQFSLFSNIVHFLLLLNVVHHSSLIAKAGRRERHVAFVVPASKSPQSEIIVGRVHDYVHPARPCVIHS